MVTCAQAAVTHQEWRIDWDPKSFPAQGQKIDAFASEHGLEIFHRYK